MATTIKIEVDEFGFPVRSVEESVRETAGLRIVITDRVVGFDELPWAEGARGAILNCLDKRIDLIVPACDLHDAISRVVHLLATAESELNFYLWQIGNILTEVHNEWTGATYEVTNEMRSLIREDKLYRLGSCEVILLRQRSEEEV